MWSGDLFGAVRWAVLSGSVLSDARTPGSDLDIVVVVDPQPGVPYRRSLTVSSWPVELFVHDPATLEHYLAKDLARRQPSLQRMCATGALLTGPHPDHQRVQAECAAVIATGPPPLMETDLARQRYTLTDLLDDLVYSIDQEETAVVAAVCWLRTAEFALHTGGHWLGSGKWLLRELRDHDPQLAKRWLAARHDPDAVVALAQEVLDRAGGRLFDGYHSAGDRAAQPAETAWS